VAGWLDKNVLLFSGSSDSSGSSTVTNSYENNPKYVNRPLNYGTLIVESQNSMKMMSKK